MNIDQIYRLFPTKATCVSHLEKVRWNDRPVCPYCGSDRRTPRPAEHRHQCNACHTSYSVTVRTVFHQTQVDLQKWFFAVSFVLNAKKNISVRQLSRKLQVNKNTAWRMGMRIRKAMAQNQQRDLFKTLLEADALRRYRFRA